MKKKEIIVDASRKESVSQVSSHQPTLSSYSTQWANISLVYLQNPQNETPEHSCVNHIIGIQLKDVLGSERRLDNIHKHEDRKLGEMAIVPANVSHWSYSGEDTKLLILALNPRFVSHIAYESVDPDRVEIIPQFSQPDPLIYGIGLALKAELESGEADNQLFIDSLKNSLCIHLLRKYSSRQHSINEQSHEIPKASFRKVIEYIHTHLHTNINLATLAELLGMSQCYFCDMFKRSLGVSPYQYVLQQRVERAKELLRQDVPIVDVALECGFVNQSHFTKQFRKLTGVTPSKYRQE
ncbi:helix-turn-helix domain-containing protein [Scytonema sp. NUACC26]|uniref:helix-turn-helix domain-containing protein n=1 Tax=Scytonema sp. NUACC26 TaxID=3140176 RepID=UPI0034DCAC8E